MSNSTNDSTLPQTIPGDEFLDKYYIGSSGEDNKDYKDTSEIWVYPVLDAAGDPRWFVLKYDFVHPYAGTASLAVFTGENSRENAEDFAMMLREEL